MSGGVDGRVIDCQCHEYHAYGYPCIQCQLDADRAEYLREMEFAIERGILTVYNEEPEDNDAPWFDGLGWYWADETLWLHGPFESKETAYRALDGYCRWLTQ